MMARLSQLIGFANVTFKKRNPSVEDVLHIRSLLNQVTLGDIGYDQQSIKKGMMTEEEKINMGFTKLPIHLITIHATNDYEIVAFGIPKHECLPIHDHPGMIVLGKVLCGSALYTSYDICKHLESTDIKYNNTDQESYDQVGHSKDTNNNMDNIENIIQNNNIDLIHHNKGNKNGIVGGSNSSPDECVTDESSSKSSQTSKKYDKINHEINDKWGTNNHKIYPKSENHESYKNNISDTENIEERGNPENVDKNDFYNVFEDSIKSYRSCDDNIYEKNKKIKKKRNQKKKPQKLKNNNATFYGATQVYSGLLNAVKDDIADETDVSNIREYIISQKIKNSDNKNNEKKNINISDALYTKSTMMCLPALGNLHQITSFSDLTVLLDILAPPYGVPRRRNCRFFEKMEIPEIEGKEYDSVIKLLPGGGPRYMHEIPFLGKK